MATGTVTFAITPGNPTMGSELGEWSLAGAATMAAALASAGDGKTGATNIDDSSIASAVPITLGAASATIPSDATNMVMTLTANCSTSNFSYLTLYDASFNAGDLSTHVLASATTVPGTLGPTTLNDQGTYSPPSYDGSYRFTGLSISQMNAGGQVLKMVFEDGGGGSGIVFDYASAITLTYNYTPVVASSKPISRSRRSARSDR